MSIYSKTFLLAMFSTGLFISTGSAADFRDYNNKAWATQGRGTSTARSNRIYRAAPLRFAAPVVVQSTPGPQQLAQAPTERRSFSYDPAQTVSDGPRMGGDARVLSIPAAPRATGVYRGFSCEPSPVFQPAPRMNSMRNTRTPAYLLPKTDPNKYRGF
jgi:hypothetical protein